MYHDRAVNDLVNGKTICEYRHKGITLITEERRQVPRVCRVGTLIGIIVSSGVRKRVFCVSGTLGAFMNMKAENGRLTGFFAVWKTFDFRSKQDAVIKLIKAHYPRYIWVGAASGNIRISRRLLFQKVR